MPEILEIAKLGNPVLRRMADPVTYEAFQAPSFQPFLDQMVATMQALDGVGLAAPQVSISKQIIVVQSQGNPRYPGTPDLPLLVLLNPVLTILSEEMIEGWEGCLSVSRLQGKVWRHKKIGLKAYDREMKPVEFEAEGFLSVVLQHEVDHLIGKVFLDRMTDFSSLCHPEEYQRYWSSSAVGAS